MNWVRVCLTRHLARATVSWRVQTPTEGHIQLCLMFKVTRLRWFNCVLLVVGNWNAWIGRNEWFLKQIKIKKSSTTSPVSAIIALKIEKHQLQRYWLVFSADSPQVKLPLHLCLDIINNYQVIHRFKDQNRGTSVCSDTEDWNSLLSHLMIKSSTKDATQES